MLEWMLRRCMDATIGCHKLAEKEALSQFCAFNVESFWCGFDCVEYCEVQKAPLFIEYQSRNDLK
jgi:hypothetical protein